MAQTILAVPAETYFVSTQGNDGWSGTLAEPNEGRTDGPFASVAQAHRVLRNLRERGLLAGPATVQLREGRYHLKTPLVFGPEDSLPVTYASYPGETATLDGGTRIEGWKTTRVNGRKAWVAELPEVAAGTWNFHELFVNDRRRRRPRLPKEGLYRIEEVPGMTVPTGWQMENGHFNRFRLGPGQMKAFRNVSDIEVVAFHFWIDERLPVASFDADTELITTSRSSFVPLVEAWGTRLAPCFLENVFEALTEPGEWYLDRSEGKVYYLPMPGETPANTEVYAPRLLQLLVLKGKPEEGHYVEWLRFEGLRFEHTEAVQPGDPRDDVWTPSKEPGRDLNRHYRGTQYGSAAQAASDVPGAVQMRGARSCAIERCRIAHIGWYGVEIGDGCTGNRLIGNEIYDLGGGGVKIGGGAFEDAACLRTGNNQVTDNHIHEGGRVFHAATGILAMHTFGNNLSHNHIHDLYYSGISCGWVWGYRASIARDNLIEKNHIHDLGQGLLSDMGGVYLLGVQPGTVVRGNLIHDVNKLNYGAWCLYTDEGSSHVILEQNICFRTNGEVFHQHYGRENIVRNNIFAFGGEALMAFSRFEGHPGFTLERNVLITHGPPIYKGGYNNVLGNRALFADSNVIWNTNGEEPQFEDRHGKVGMDAWRKLGRDLHSVVADPQCRGMRKDDFTLKKGSPAWGLGFERIDLSDVGPRGTTGT